MRVVAHRYARDRAYPNGPLLDGDVPGCGAGLLDARGAYCPSVSYPGVTLSEAQIAELLAIANSPNRVPSVVMSGYDFNQGFVFFDDQARPIAQLLVNNHADKVLMTPRPSDDRVDTLEASRRGRLRALLLELGLMSEEDAGLEELWQKQREADGWQHFPLRYLPSKSGVPPEVMLDQVSQEQKRQLCHWFAYVWTSGAPHAGSGIECPDGYTALGQDLRQCISTFPGCHVSTGEVEDCMRRQRADSCYEKPENAHCLAQRECLWGIVPFGPPSGSAHCPVGRQRVSLVLTPLPGKAPRSQLLDHLRKLTDDVQCDRSSIVVGLSGAEAQLMFGRHLQLSGVAGAGNSTTTCGWFAELTPPDFMPASVAPYASSVRVDTDPKLPLLNRLRDCQ